MKSPIWKVLACFGAFLLPALAQVSVTTSRNNNSRDGQNLSETVLTPAKVSATSFGKLFSQSVDGYIYAQPLYVPNVAIPGLGVHNVVYVATQHDSVYAFDADSNTGRNSSPLWHRSFIYPKHGINTVSSGNVGCGDIVPEIGITSTPVIDPATGTMYLIAKTKESGKVLQRLHALDITNGAERPGSPVVIWARVKGSGDGSVNGMITFNPLRQAQRPGLLLQNGSVYIGWASHCDIGPYHGWMMSYDEATLKQIAVWNSTPNGGLGGIWQAGTGLAADSNFNVFFATGNGTYDGKKGGDDFSDTVAKLAPPVGNRFPLVDWFTPYNQLDLSNSDADVGSGGVVLLPDQGNGAPHQHLLVQVGKEGSIYLIDRDKMGHFHPNDNSQIVQDMENVIGGMWATPAWWNNNVYFGGTDDNLKQYTFDPTTGLLSGGAVAVSPNHFGFPGTTPSISANGTSDAIVWALQTDAYGIGSATLHAYDATDVGTELYNSNQSGSRDDPGGAVKFTVPTVANGKVYVPAVQQLTVFGLLAGSLPRK
jgi:hypothetical protein